MVCCVVFVWYDILVTLAEVCMKPTVEESIKELRKVADIVRETQPLWAEKLDIVCNECDRLDQCAQDYYED